jgi:rhodanese-related sulfurtransferase
MSRHGGEPGVGAPARWEMRYDRGMQANSLSFITAMLLFMSASATVPSRTQAASSEDSSHITAADLNELIKTGRTPVIVDVRSSREYKAGHVPGAIHLPFWLAFARADDIDAPKDELVVVYCAHGPRAGIGKAALSLEGYTQIRYLQGHMSGWYKAELPVETSPQ